MSNAQTGPDGELIVEKIVHVDNSQKMKAMEDALEKEKKEIKKKFEKEKKKIMAQTEMNEGEKEKLLEQLSKKEES